MSSQIKFLFLLFRTKVVGTPLRTDPRYKLYYLFWAKLIFTELIPYVTIVVFNSFIVVKIVQSSRFRRRVLKNMSNNDSTAGGGGGGGAAGLNGQGSPLISGGGGEKEFNKKKNYKFSYI